ncbi:MAG: hypothetical protein J6J39_05400 [Clostridia bacterium]|nr:hypothetical protein [Clostridia bacterium]
MKTGFKKLAIIVFTVAIILTQCIIPAFALTPQTVQFDSNAVSAKKGDTITLPIVISSDKAIDIGGLSLYIKYKTDCLSYVEGSGAPLVDGMSDAVFFNSTTGRLSFAWTSGKVLTIPKKTVLLKPQFKVLDSAVEDADAQLVITEAYTISGAQVIDLTVGNANINFDITVASEDSQVQKVEKLINDIGKVEYSDECLKKIVDAASAYSILNENQKQKVSNYNKLSEALVEYERLRIEAEESAVSEEISKFMDNHKTALALTTDTVKISDETAVLNAINAFNRLSKEAQYKIYSYSSQLKTVREKITALKKTEEQKQEAAAEEARLRKEAQQYAATFKEEKAPFLSLKVEDLLADHYTGLNDALENINMLSELNPYVNEYLKVEKALLTEFMEKVKEIIKQNEENQIPSEQIDADIFRNTFSYILSLTAETVTIDDAIDVRLASAMYEMLDPAVQALLSNEYSIIEELLSKVDTLSPEADTEAEDDGEAEGDNQPVVNNGGSAGVGKVTMRFANRQMGAIIWILLLLFALSAIIFAALQVFYHYFCKPRMAAGDDEWEEEDI